MLLHTLCAFEAMRLKQTKKERIVGTVSLCSWCDCVVVAVCLEDEVS